jgi:hypothetical protein
MPGPTKLVVCSRQVPWLWSLAGHDKKTRVEHIPGLPPERMAWRTARQSNFFVPKRLGTEGARIETNKHGHRPELHLSNDSEASGETIRTHEKLSVYVERIFEYRYLHLHQSSRMSEAIVER